MTINELIAECTAYDYKLMLEEGRPKSWLKSVSAFANTVGGSLFFGIDNDRTVKGYWIRIRRIGSLYSSLHHISL